MNVLVTGITGYVGSRLAPRLLRDGHAVRGFARAPHAGLGVPVCTGDAVSGTGLDRALQDIDLAYYLIHSMEPDRGSGRSGEPGRGGGGRGSRRSRPSRGSRPSFGVRERTAAENFARAARAAGVARIVYLGGLLPANAHPSPHLASRQAVEEILLSGAPGSVALRASIVIGAHSRSFRFLVRLVERMPVLALPAWRHHRTRPIDERDVSELLARAGTEDAVRGCSLDIGGPDVISYGELIERIRDHMLINRPTIGLGRLSVTPIASRISALVAGEEHALVGPLMEGLEYDLLPRDDRGATILGVKLHTLDAAIERSLRDWEASEPLAAR